MVCRTRLDPPEARKVDRRRGAGFARRYDWNPLVVRLVIIASIVLPGSQVLAYVALWILMPRDPESTT